MKTSIFKKNGNNDITNKNKNTKYRSIMSDINANDNIVISKDLLAQNIHKIHWINLLMH